MTIQEIASEINDRTPYGEFHLSAYDTSEGMEWTCEIIGLKWPDVQSLVCEEGHKTPEEAANAAYQEWKQLLEVDVE